MVNVICHIHRYRRMIGNDWTRLIIVSAHLWSVICRRWGGAYRTCDSSATLLYLLAWVSRRYARLKHWYCECNMHNIVASSSGWVIDKFEQKNHTFCGSSSFPEKARWKTRNIVRIACSAVEICSNCGKANSKLSFHFGRKKFILIPTSPNIGGNVSPCPYWSDPCGDAYSVVVYYAVFDFLCGQQHLRHVR